MKKILIFFSVILGCQPALAEPTFLKCTGNQKVLIGENIYAPKSQSDVMDFELGVDTKAPELFGYPTRIAPGCFEKDVVKNQIDDTKSSCSVNNLEVSCRCENDMALSTIKASRRTGLLEVISTFKKSNMTMGGKFSCVKSNAKVF